MTLKLTEDEARFEQRVRDWVREVLEPAWQVTYRAGSPEWVAFQKAWDRSLYEGGWAGIFWPPEYGGTKATATERFLYAKVMAEEGAPEGLAKVGRRLLAPMLMAHGTPDQKDRYLGPILRAEEFWCQGFSEPDAGSDLASLRMKAEGDLETGFRLSGQKIWTSHAEHCEFVFVLARSWESERKHDGISFFLLPVESPGITIRPIRQINGASEFSEMFFDDVAVPPENLVGELGKGWHVAMSLLGYERGVEQALGKSAATRRAFERLLGALAEFPAERQAEAAAAVGGMQAEILAVYANAVRLLSQQLEGDSPTEMASVLKLQSSETWRSSAHQQLVLHPPGTHDDVLRDESAIGDYLQSRSATIAAGTSEIQRNIIAKRVLGMGRRTREK